MLTGIIGAMDIETDALKKLMTDTETKKISGIDFCRGKINGADAVVAVAGVGKVNAAVCAQSMILTYSPDMIINAGVAGGLDDSLKIGDIVVADKVAEHDMDTTPIGDPKGFISGLDTVYMECDKDITDALIAAAKELDGVNVLRGVIASGDQFICNDTERNRIKSEFNAAAAEMEGASIGHVSVMNSVPFGVLRSVSDCANGDSVTDYPTFAKKAAENSVKIILEFLKRRR